MLCVLNAKVREKSGIKKRETATHATHTAKHASTLASTQKRGIKKCESLSHMEKASLPFSPLSEHVKRDAHTQAGITKWKRELLPDQQAICQK